MCIEATASPENTKNHKLWHMSSDSSVVVTLPMARNATMLETHYLIPHVAFVASFSSNKYIDYNFALDRETSHLIRPLGQV